MSVVGASGMNNPNPACYHCLPTTLGVWGTGEKSVP